MGKVRSLWKDKIDEVEINFLNGAKNYDETYFALKGLLNLEMARDSMEFLVEIKGEQNGGE